MKIKVNQSAATNLSRLNYVLSFLESHPITGGKLTFVKGGEEKADLVIDYGSDSGADLYIPSQHLFFGEDPVDSFSFSANSYTFEGLKLYSVEKDACEVREFFSDSATGFDIFECIFFHISRYEEVFCDENLHNDHSMLDNHLLFLPKNELEKIPVVDHLVYAFCKITGLNPEVRKSSYSMTHDIDQISKFNKTSDVLRSFLWPIIRRFDFVWAIRNILQFVWLRRGRTKDPYHSYDYLFRSSGKWLAKEIYFMTGGNSKFDLVDNHYLEELGIVWKVAKAHNYEAGIHPSYNSADDMQMMMEEKLKLEDITGEKIRLNRQHYLHYYFGITDKHIEKIGFKKDSTLAYNRLIGFRCGTGFDFKPYNFAEERAFEFYESPLAVMDSALIHESKDDMELFNEILFSFIEQNKDHTHITFNFHNSTFDTGIPHRKSLKAIYQNMVKRIENMVP